MSSVGARRMIIAAGLITTWAALRRLGRRSGASPAEIALTLPGDDLVVDPTLVCDRVATMPVASAALWPWVVQLGKDRAGWYLPVPLALVFPVERRGSQVVEPAYQRLAVDDVVPDWGPLPFRVAALEAPRHLVYRAERADRPLQFSWALVLRPVDDGTRLHLRLRLRGNGRHRVVKQALGGFVDYVTVELMFAGLRQRLSSRRVGRQSADQ